MPYLSYKTVKLFFDDFVKHFQKYSVQTYTIDNDEYIYVLDDSLVILVAIVRDDATIPLNFAYKSDSEYIEYKENKYLGLPVGGETYCLQVIELTHNNIGFKFNVSDFVRSWEKKTGISCLSLNISYVHFTGWARKYWCSEEESVPEYINRTMPQLRLRERYEAWSGFPYNFLIIRFQDVNMTVVYAVGYTMQSPNQYVRKLVRSYIAHGSFSTDSLRGWNELKRAVETWKGIPRKKRFEDYLSYCSIKEFHREKSEVWRRADKILELTYSGEYSKNEFISYCMPISRWSSEEYLYNVIKNKYKKYAVIWQHRPFFLRSSRGGQMSYDVFISKLNIAIEYQGEQHFRPVDFFGGEEGFKRTQERDREKAKLSKENNVRLAYFTYEEDLTPELIYTRIERVINS